jgi:hypothetical protein
MEHRTRLGAVTGRKTQPTQKGNAAQQNGEAEDQLIVKEI